MNEHSGEHALPCRRCGFVGEHTCLGAPAPIGPCPNCGERCDNERCECTCIQRPTVPIGRVLDPNGGTDA